MFKKLLTLACCAALCLGPLGAARAQSSPALQAQQGFGTKVGELLKAGRTADAEAVARSALAEAERSGPDSQPVVIALVTMSSVQLKRLDTAGAEASLERASRVAERQFGPIHIVTSVVDTALCGVSTIRGNFLKAQPAASRALAAHESLAGANPAVAALIPVSLVLLATTERELGNYSAADTHLQRSLPLFRRARGGQVHVARLLADQAALQELRGDTAQAARLYQEALAIQQNTPNALLEQARSLNGLGSLARQAGDFDAAADFHQRARKLVDQAPASRHDLATTLREQGRLAQARGQLDEAEALYRQSILEVENGGNPGDINLPAFLLPLAELYEQTGRQPQAKALYLRSQGITEKTLGEGAKELSTALVGLARIQRAEGPAAPAEALLQRAVAAIESSRGPQHPNLLAPLDELAALYAADGRNDEATALLARADGFRRQVR